MPPMEWMALWMEWVTMAFTSCGTEELHQFLKTAKNHNVEQTNKKIQKGLHPLMFPVGQGINSSLSCIFCFIFLVYPLVNDHLSAPLQADRILKKRGGWQSACNQPYKCVHFTSITHSGMAEHIKGRGGSNRAALTWSMSACGECTKMEGFSLGDDSKQSWASVALALQVKEMELASLPSYSTCLWCSARWMSLSDLNLKVLCRGGQNGGCKKLELRRREEVCEPKMESV